MKSDNFVIFHYNPLHPSFLLKQSSWAADACGVSKNANTNKNNKSETVNRLHQIIF